MSVISCKGCGSVVDDAWSVCPQCGADPRIGTVETPTVEPSTAAPARSDEGRSAEEKPARGPEPAYEPEPAFEEQPAAPTIQGLATEASVHETPSRPHERRRQPHPKTKKASGLGCLGLVLLAILGFVFDVYTSPEKDTADDYNRLVDRITVIQNRVWTTPGKIDRLLANDVLAPLITRNGAEVTVHDPGFSGAAQLLPVVQEAKAVIAGNNGDLATLAALWDEMARLESGEERDTYARQQKDLVVLDRQIGDLTVQYFGTLAEACEGAPLSRAQEEQFGQKASDILARIEPLQSRYQELSKASEQYYNEHF